MNQMPILLFIVFIFSGCSSPQIPKTKAPSKKEVTEKTEPQDKDIQESIFGGPIIFEEVDEKIHIGGSDKNAVENIIDVFMEEVSSLKEDDYDEMYEEFLSKKYTLVQQKFIDSINNSIDKAYKIYNQKLLYPIVTFDKPALKTAAYAAASFRVKYSFFIAIPIIDIKFKGQNHLENLEVYRKYQSEIDQYIDVIAVHEVAHYVNFELNGRSWDDGHNSNWCNVMHDLEANPSDPFSFTMSKRSKPVPLPDGSGESFTITTDVISLGAYCLPEVT